MKKLAIITTHPIQYYAPIFKLLYQRNIIDLKVFFTWGEKVKNKFDPGFNKIIDWDIPLLDGYPYEWVKNISEDPGTHHFKGIINPDLIDQIKLFQPDAILIYGWAYKGHLKALRYFKNKIPIFFRGDSTLLDEKFGAKTLLKTIFLKWVYSHIDRAIYVGKNSKAYFKKYGIKESQLNFVPHSVDNIRFAIKRDAEVETLKHKLGISETDIIIMFAGKLEEKKAPLLLLKAFLNIDITHVHLLFVGNGPLEKELKTNAKDIPNVHFIDFQNQSQMPVVYQVCDIFCLPSKGPGETWGLAINEAMACGKTILVSDKVGGALDLVIPDYNGIIFNSESLNDLSSNLNHLIKKGKIGLNKIGQHSTQIIKDWDIKVQVEAMESIVTTYT